MADKLDEIGGLDDESLDEEQEEQEGASEAKKGFKLLSPNFAKIILIIIAVILIVAISVTASFFVIKNMIERPAIQADGETITAKMDPYTNWDPGEFSINTADTEETHFINIQLALAFDMNNTILSSELDQRKAQIRDIINSILSSKYMRELITTEGRSNLKLEIKNSINNILKQGRITDVYIIDFVMQ